MRRYDFSGLTDKIAVSYLMIKELLSYGIKERADAVGLSAKCEKEILDFRREQKVRQRLCTGGICLRKFFGVGCHDNKWPPHDGIVLDENFHSCGGHFAGFGRDIADNHVGIVGAGKLQNVPARDGFVFEEPIAARINAGQGP